jgi:hypothetical protein
MIITKNGCIIRSVNEWFDLAPPEKGVLQWKCGRSAKELAKAWFPAGAGISVPKEFLSMVNSQEALGSVKLCEGEPEACVPFDCFKSPRKCDLLVHGVCGLGRIAISVEAKADETFGQEIGDYFWAMQRNPNSKVPERIRRLALAVLGMQVVECRDLRYQLLYGTAAALSAADKYGAAIAAFVVHEFVTPLSDDARHEQNAADLDRFVSALSRGRFPHVYAGHLYGPLRVPGNEYISDCVDLYIGKARRNTRPENRLP